MKDTITICEKAFYDKCAEATAGVVEKIGSTANDHGAQALAPALNAVTMGMNLTVDAGTRLFGESENLQETEVELTRDAVSDALSTTAAAHSDKLSDILIGAILCASFMRALFYEAEDKKEEDTDNG